MLKSEGFFSWDFKCWLFVLVVDIRFSVTVKLFIIKLIRIYFHQKETKASRLEQLVDLFFSPTVNTLVQRAGRSVIYTLVQSPVGLHWVKM
jgi:hypothetical protein